MLAASRGLRVAAVLVSLAGSAHAGKLAVGRVVSEPDVADEAGAVTLLVHSALVGDDRTLVELPGALTIGSAPVALKAAGADHALLMDLGREGVKLRLTVVIVGGDGLPDVTVTRAGDGDVQALARAATERVATKLALMKGRVPDVSLGMLRPFATALRLRSSDPAAAARALADAAPSTALSVPAANTLLAGLPGTVPDATLAVIAARAIADTRHLDAVGDASGEGTRVAARTFAAIARTDLADARAQLGPKPPKGALVTIARATLAEIAGDHKLLSELLVTGLASNQSRAVLALASTFSTLDQSTLAVLVEAAEKVAAEAPGVTSLIGLAAAEAGVDKPRALALVSVRELDEHGLKRLEPLIAGATDATSLRLRAELAMRRGDPNDELAIGAFAAAAPDDPRGSLYHGRWLAAHDRPAEAARAFAKAGARREQIRALIQANELQAAASLLDNPSTPEELALLARIALLEGRLADAEAKLALAERGAPISPLVQRVIVDVGVKSASADRTRLARLLLGDTSAAVVPAPIVSAPTGGNKPPQKLVIDLSNARGDSRFLEPMIEAMQLQELAKKKVVVVELAWTPKALSLRETHPGVVRDALVQLLAAPPYELQVALAPRSLSGETVPLDELVTLSAQSDVVLVYRVEPAGSQARVTLLAYQTGTSVASQVTRVIAMPGVVSFNLAKLIGSLGVLVTALLIGVLYFTRAMGRVEIQIARSADVDEALCVEITKRASRPPIPDMLAFHTATRSAGAIHSQRQATLVASGLQMRVPAGSWYVHLYGTYSHGGKLRLVPDACTQEVDVKRGGIAEVAFDLLAKSAEITVQVIVEPRRGVMVWTDVDGNKVATSDAGEVELNLPLGTRTIYVEAHGNKFEKELQVSSAKPQRLTINVARELRLLKDVEFDANADTHNDLELVLSPSGPRTPLPFAAAAPPAPSTSTPPAPPSIAAHAQTQAATGADMVAALAGSQRLPRAMTPVPGDMLLGRYRVVSELGRGAMGLVHRAWDEKLEREVAIKEMADDLRSIPEALQLFTQEAKALAQLNHSNIVAMYDQVTDVDKVYMIMEYVDGRPLESVVAERGALPWIDAIAIIDQVCAGLAFAHARKVIHRDIKPANIFVGHDRTVKLGDFGLARVMREVTIRRTEIRGTPLYMAPEQITGMDVDHRVDLYAVGCTLFELVCGRPPFVDGDILYAQMNTAPPVPSSLVPDLPPALDHLIIALIAKHPDDRPASAHEVRSMLRSLS